MQNPKFGILNGNHLKLIAAFTMLLDHAGILLFPRVTLFRILGRLAYPIYAYMIAEGCRYTRNKLRYFLMVFGLGAATVGRGYWRYPALCPTGDPPASPVLR